MRDLHILRLAWAVARCEPPNAVAAAPVGE